MRVSSTIHSMNGGSANASFTTDDLQQPAEFPEAHQIEAARNRRQIDVERKQFVQSMGKMLGDFSSVVDEMANPAIFKSMQVESSQGDILSGEVTGRPDAGTYEIEVKSLARPSRILAHGFPDKDQTPVGVGSLSLSVNGLEHDVTIAPGSKLIDVADAINSSVSGVKASIINTGAQDEPFVLMVTNLSSGAQTDIELDPDTTFLEVSKKFDGQDLEVSFEGIQVKRPVNAVADLVSGLNLKGKSAAPGVNVAVQVNPDKRQASDKVRAFVDQYNAIQSFGGKQTTADVSGSSLIQGDSSVRQVTRSLQAVIQDGDLFKFGITTDPKTGKLQIDDSKLSMELANNYDQVVSLFASDGDNVGLADRLKSVIRGLQSKTDGALGQRLKGLEQKIRRQDQEIEKRELQLQYKSDQMKKRLSAIESRMGSLAAEGTALNQRING